MQFRLKNPIYRCYRCGRIITAIEIQRKWEKWEKKKESRVDLCKCGSRHISPGNATLLDELFRPKIWLLWYHWVFKPWLSKKLAR